MNFTSHDKLISFIWSIADGCLRDIYVRGKYRAVILPMVVLRRLDSMLQPTKEVVLDEVRFQRKEMKVAVLDDAPCSGCLILANRPPLAPVYNEGLWLEF